jgi:hypothetical protein
MSGNAVLANVLGMKRPSSPGRDFAGEGAGWWVVELIGNPIEVGPHVARAVEGSEVLTKLGKSKWVAITCGLRFGVPQVLVV